ncbi:MAG: hypothetical protein J7L54_03790 [Elusimicrobia bacterium]|nr:hypothetical protein [Elusimicrobiota bacterium]
MSFRESEFPDLLENILKVGEQYGDNSLTFEIVKKVVELVKQIPLYPGIVGMCLARYVSEADPAKLNPGDRIFVKTAAGGIAGNFDGDEDDFIRVKGDSEAKIEKSKIEKILKLRDNILEEIWPTLVFKEEK